MSRLLWDFRFLLDWSRVALFLLFHQAFIGCQHHKHGPAFHLWRLFHCTDVCQGRRDLVQVFQRDLAWLTACDVLVAEASGSSYGVGFEVGYVLGRAKASGQRVVLLYDRARRDKISRLITGNDDDACETFGYKSVEELTDFIDRRFAEPCADER